MEFLLHRLKIEHIIAETVNFNYRDFMNLKGCFKMKMKHFNWIF